MGLAVLPYPPQPLQPLPSCGHCPTTCVLGPSSEIFCFLYPSALPVISVDVPVCGCVLIYAGGVAICSLRLDIHNCRNSRNSIGIKFCWMNTWVNIIKADGHQMEIRSENFHCEAFRNCYWDWRHWERQKCHTLTKEISCTKGDLLRKAFHLQRKASGLHKHNSLAICQLGFSEGCRTRDLLDRWFSQYLSELFH